MSLSKISFTQNPGFVNPTNLTVDKQLKCCVICSAQASGIPEAIMDQLLEDSKDIYEFVKNLESLLKSNSISRKCGKRIMMLVNNLADFTGNYEPYVIHPHYYIPDVFQLSFENPVLPVQNNSLKKGQVFIIYELNHRASDSDILIRRVMESHNQHRMDPHLYQGLSNFPMEEVVVISSGDDGGRYENTGHAGITFNSDVDLDGRICVDENYITNELQEHLVVQKDFFNPNPTVIVVDKLPFTSTEEMLYYPSAKPWLQLIQRVYGPLKNLAVILIVEAEDFVQTGISLTRQVDEIVKEHLVLGEQIEIFSIDATTPGSWSHLSTITTT